MNDRNSLHRAAALIAGTCAALVAALALQAAADAGALPPPPSQAALFDTASINQSLQGLGNPLAGEFVGFALNHQVEPCAGAWPRGVDPTVPMVDKFYSACWLMKDPSLSRSDEAYILAHIPTWKPRGVHPVSDAQNSTADANDATYSMWIGYAGQRVSMAWDGQLPILETILQEETLRPDWTSGAAIVLVNSRYKQRLHPDLEAFVSAVAALEPIQ